MKIKCIAYLLHMNHQKHEAGMEFTWAAWRFIYVVSIFIWRTLHTKKISIDIHFYQKEEVAHKKRTIIELSQKITYVIYIFIISIVVYLILYDVLVCQRWNVNHTIESKCHSTICYRNWNLLGKNENLFIICYSYSM